MLAKTLQRTLGTSYRVAWVMLQRYRVAMVRPNRSLLAGNVEVDETLVGGVKQHGKRGRGAHKNIVVIAVEVKFPKGAIVGAIVRNEEIIIPRGNNMIRPHDHLILFALKDHLIPNIYKRTWKNLLFVSIVELPEVVDWYFDDLSNKL